jgi:hypothetical protein
MIRPTIKKNANLVAFTTDASPVIGMPMIASV